MMPDTFSPDVFTMTSLTDAINKLKYAPGRIGSLGLFHEQGINTLDLMIEEKDGVLTLVDVASRNSPGKPVNAGKRVGRSFRVPHLPESSAIMADEVQGVRLFGSDNATETMQQRINERLQIMRGNIDYTIEAHRLAALLPSVTGAPGSPRATPRGSSIGKRSVICRSMPVESPVSDFATTSWSDPSISSSTARAHSNPRRLQ